MLLLYYNKTRVLIYLPWLFHIWVLGMTTKGTCGTVNRDTPFPTANTTIRHIHICSVMLFVITRKKLTLKFL
jgi:hypothetical protein